MQRLVDFLKELRRRRVFRVAAIYGAVGWTVIEASTVLVERLSLPPWTANLLIAFVLLGFPLALVLAWAFEVTPEGVVRDPAGRPEDERGPAAGGRGRRASRDRPDAPRRDRPPASQGGRRSRRGERRGPEPARGGTGGPDGRQGYDGETIHFSSPSAEGGTFKLLPGRLEVVEGADRGEDIRFESPPDGPPEFTFGRRQSPDPTHIQLKVRTVSREHAVMRRLDDRWEIENRSTTNPVQVNDERLSEEGATTELGDGDLIDMGELRFKFHER